MVLIVYSLEIVPDQVLLVSVGVAPDALTQVDARSVLLVRAYRTSLAPITLVRLRSDVVGLRLRSRSCRLQSRPEVEAAFYTELPTPHARRTHVDYATFATMQAG